jgi:hypothetical protein
MVFRVSAPPMDCARWPSFHHSSMALFLTPQKKRGKSPEWNPLIICPVVFSASSPPTLCSGWHFPPKCLPVSDASSSIPIEHSHAYSSRALSFLQPFPFSSFPPISSLVHSRELLGIKNIIQIILYAKSLALLLPAISPIRWYTLSPHSSSSLISQSNFSMDQQSSVPKPL